MMFGRFKRLVLGTPLASHRERHERLTIPLALAVFASDALSSTAYATEEILLSFTMAAAFIQQQANLLSLPVAAAILLLMVVVVISYRQVIRAYSDGGGAYVVAKRNLGITASLVAGSALLIDYILTVAVSISAGVAAITSTGLIDQSYSLLLAMGFLLFIMLVNLRGVRESGFVFAVFSYLFIACMVSLLATGFWNVTVGHAPVPVHTTVIPPTGTGGGMGGLLQWVVVGAFLNAFAHGCSALTGIEAISNGVKAFKEPVDLNANRTMALMGCLLGGIFMGVTYLAYVYHILPTEHETVISQVARATFGGGNFFYYLIQAATMIILVMAANTSFTGFPRLATLLAQDGFLPRQLMNLGDRLVFTNGILLLGLVSGFLIWLARADHHQLIPFYAVGVFLSFTLAQAGMVVHHKREKHKGWKSGLVINLVGAIVTGLVTILLMEEKFDEFSWVIAIIIGLLIVFFRMIYNHYRSIGKQLALPEKGYCPVPIEHTVLVLVSSLNKGTIPALEYAKTISERVEAVHVELKPDATERLRKAWDEWGCGIPLTILKSPYRSISEPLLDYIDEVESRYEHDLVTIIIPEFVTKKAWHNILHNQTSLLIKTLLRFRKGKVVTTVRYYLEE